MSNFSYGNPVLVGCSTRSVIPKLGWCRCSCTAVPRSPHQFLAKVSGSCSPRTPVLPKLGNHWTKWSLEYFSPLQFYDSMKLLWMEAANMDPLLAWSDLFNVPTYILLHCAWSTLWTVHYAKNTLLPAGWVLNLSGWNTRMKGWVNLESATKTHWDWTQTMNWSLTVRLQFSTEF